MSARPFPSLSAWLRFAAIGVAAGASAFGAASAMSRDAGAVTLIHSNDVMGDIEPCGCRTNPQGGMARKANLVKRLQASPAPDGGQLLQLDAGDLLFSADTVPELLSRQAELQAGYLLRSMDELRHDAIVPGEKDFALGLKRFERLIKKSKSKFLAANLVRRNGRKLFERSAIFTRKDKAGKPLKIAVIGIVGEDLPFPKELKALPAVAAARREVGALRKKADLVILLTHQGLDKDRALAEAVPGIDIIVGGHTQSFLQQPLQVGKTTIYQSSFRNQYVGALPLAKPFTGADYQLIGLDAGYDSPGDAPGKMDDLVREFKTSIAELNSREEAKLTASASPSTEGGPVPKFQTFPKCAECHLKQFDFWRKTPHAMALTTLVQKGQARNKECLACHTVGLGDPQGFSVIAQIAEFKRMPKAKPVSESAEAAGAFSDPEASFNAEAKIEPISIEDLSAYLKAVHDAKSLKDNVRVMASEEPLPIRKSISALHRAWTPVQCENCHQPGHDHPFSGTFNRQVEKTACLKCHTSDRAPGWYTQSGKPDWGIIDAKRALMTCPKGDLEDPGESED